MLNNHILKSRPCQCFSWARDGSTVAQACTKCLLIESMDRCLHHENIYYIDLIENLTSPFAILEIYNPSHDVPEVHKIRRSTDFKALKLLKRSSGSPLLKQGLKVGSRNSEQLRHLRCSRRVFPELQRKNIVLLEISNKSLSREFSRKHIPYLYSISHRGEQKQSRRRCI